MEEEGRWLKWRSLGEDTGIVEKADAIQENCGDRRSRENEVAETWGRHGNRRKG